MWIAITLIAAIFIVVVAIIALILKLIVCAIAYAERTDDMYREMDRG